MRDSRNGDLSSPPHATQYFENIDLLRGFAAISVLVYHVIEHWNWTTFPASGPMAWFRHGWIGVDLFFVISGFVVTLAAFREIDTRGTNAFRWPFALRRVARIVPLHYTTLLLFTLGAFLIAPHKLPEDLLVNFIAHLAFVHNFHPEWHGALNGPNWSLGTEMQFYVLVAIIAPWLLRQRWWLIAATFVFTAWIWRALALYISPDPGTHGPTAIFVFSTQLPGMLDEFAVGILLARFVRSSAGQRAQDALFRSVPLRRSLLGASFMLAALFIIWTWPRLPAFWTSPDLVVFYRTGLAIAIVPLIFAISINGNHPIAAKGLLPLRYLGKISYGIYLWHLPVLLAAKQLIATPGIAVLLLVIGITLVLAALSWHLIEKPIIDRVRTANGHRQPSQ